MNYRKEIDGLRAIAVLPVILFHGGFHYFSGGYIGVDVFFVISGYLITTIILEDIQKNRFTVTYFYERRARRILPALTVVLFITTLAAFILLPAVVLEKYSQSLVSVSVFASNLFFYMTDGYFSTVAEQKPLLHTWSLAVEEQFYILFPLLAVVIFPYGRKYFIAVTLAIALASLYLAQHLSLSGLDNFNFYLLFSRAWELLFGCLLALVSIKSLRFTPTINELLAFAGLSLIIYAIFYFSEDTPFPGLYTLVPVIGTCLILIYADSTTLTGKLLSLKPLVFTGLISYSLYLWHQPLFAFIRIKTVGRPVPEVFLFATFCAFMLSYISWKYVEVPFRNRALFDRKTIFRYSLLSVLFFICVGLITDHYRGFSGRFYTSTYQQTIQFSPKREHCHTEGNDYLRPSSACSYFSNNVTWAVFGDSHVVETAYALATELEKHNLGLKHLSFSDCSPALLFEAKEEGCTRWLNESLEYLEHDNNIKNVVLAFRYSYYLSGNHVNDYPDLPDQNPSRLFYSDIDISKSGARELYWNSLYTLINRLLDSNKHVYVLYPVPELPVNINLAIMPFSVFSSNSLLDLERATTVDYYLKRHAFILGKLDNLNYGDRLHAIKPLDILCDTAFCAAVKNSNALYFDDDHLSLYGATLIAKEIASTALTD